MAELVLAVVGVVPVIVEAIKTYRKIHSCVKTARKCSHHLRDICLNLETQRALFLNECVFLLRQIGYSEATGRCMVEDTSHLSWNSSLEGRLERLLGASYELCQQIIARICEIQDEVNERLEVFKQIRSAKAKDESLKVAFQRLYKSTKFTFDKCEIEHRVSILREKISDLQAIRSQTEQLENNPTQKRHAITAKSMPKEFAEVQQISSEAYGALKSSFHCTDDSHHGHLASLCLDVEYVESIQLKVASTYERNRRDSVEDRPLWFHLQPKPSNDIPQSDECCSSQRVQVSSALTLPNQGLANTKVSPYASGKSKKRKVTFANLPEPQLKAVKRSTEVGTENLASTEPTLDLRAIINACHYLRQKFYCPETERSYSSCIAFFRQREMSRYIFYMTTGRSVVEEQISPFNSKISLYDHLQLENERNITMCHRLTLALKLTRAVLQFHSSPWLEEEWSLAQLQLLSGSKKGSGDLSLYLNSRLLGQPSISDPETLPDSVTPERKADKGENLPLSAAQHRGIYNITLFCLGIALLEIAHWKSLEELQREQDHDRIDAARRLANSSTMLGPWYDTAIQKCLRCDFAFGCDLNKEALQRAIYSDVICPLEDLVMKLNGLTIGA